MKTRIIFALAAMLLTLFVADAQAQIRQREAIRLVYDVDFEMNFDFKNPQNKKTPYWVSFFV